MATTIPSTSGVQTVNIYEAKTQLSKLVDLASGHSHRSCRQAGGAVDFAEAGKAEAGAGTSSRARVDCGRLQ